MVNLSGTTPLLYAATATLLIWSGSGIAQDDGVPVRVATTEERTIIEPIAVSGSFVSTRNAQISVATAGLIDRIRVSIGDSVEQGDVLIELDAALIEKQLAAATAMVKQLEVSRADAQEQLTELESLIEDNNVAASEVRRARASFNEAAANYDAAVAEQERTRELLNQHQLTAPFSGLVAQRLVDLGEWVNPGDQVFQLIDTDALYADFYVSQRYFSQIDTDTELTLRLDGTDDEYAAKVVTKVGSASEQTRTFVVRAQPTEGKDMFFPGLAVRGTFRLGGSETGIVIPRDALLRYPDGRTTAWVVLEKDGGLIAEERSLTIGQAFDGVIEIVEGLASGDRVVTRGNESLQEQQNVRIREE